MQQQSEGTKPFYDSTFMFSKVMNQSIKRACRKRLEVLLGEEEKSFEKWKEISALERHKAVFTVTRKKQLERNFYKRINALKIVCWMLSDLGSRTGDLPEMVTVRNHRPVKETKRLDAPPQEVPMLSQDNLNMLVNLAKLLNTKNS
jgi:hypothetical protein